MLGSAPGNRLFDMIYFTATTMSTVGYGDISPLSYVARASRPDRLDRVLEEDEEFQDLKAEWEASNHECAYCKERMNQILAYYNRPPSRYCFP